MNMEKDLIKIDSLTELEYGIALQMTALEKRIAALEADKSRRTPNLEWAENIEKRVDEIEVDFTRSALLHLKMKSPLENHFKYADLVKRIAVLEEELKELSAMEWLNNLQKRIAALEKWLGNVGDLADALESEGKDYEKRIAELEDRLSARMAALEDRLDFYRTQKDNEKEERIAALEEYVNDRLCPEELHNKQQRLTVLEMNLSKLDSDFTASIGRFEGRIAALENKITRLNESIDELCKFEDRTDERIAQLERVAWIQGQ